MAGEPLERMIGRVRQFSGEMAVGARRLTRLGLENLSSPGAFPVLWACPEARGKLCFRFVEDEDHGFLFSLFRDADEEDKIADLRLSLVLGGDRISCGPWEEASRLRFSCPEFLKNPGEKDRLVLKPLEGPLLRLVFSADKNIFLYRGGESVSGDWPMEILVLVLDLIRSWLLRGRPGSHRPFSLPPGPPLFRLAGSLVAALRLVEDSGVHERMSETLSGIGFPVKECLVRALVQLDDDGLLRNRDKETNWQQYDVEILRTRRAGAPRFLLSMYPPDFLVSGPVFKRFLGVIIKSKAFRDGVQEADSLVNEEEAFQFLNSPGLAARAMVVRIAEENLDLVHLAGTLQGKPVRLLFSANFDVSGYPKLEVKMRGRPDLISVSREGESFSGELSPGSPHRRYLVRLFRTLRLWQSGMARAVAEKDSI